MRRLIYIFILSIAIMAMFSCSPRVIKTASIDSTYRERTVTVIDTIIDIEKDSSLYQAFIECDSLGNAYLGQIKQLKEGSRTKVPVITIEPIPGGNVLNVECECDSLGIYLSMYRIREKDTEHRIEKEVLEVEVNRLTWWQQTQLYLLRIFIIMFSIYLFIKKIGLWTSK